MDLKIENDVEKQNQLKKQIEELQDEKIKLQYRINVLIDCLSIEKLEKKVSELTNKQKILMYVESVIINMRAEIQPLNYLKEVLQRKLMATTLSTDDFNTEVQNVSESPVVFTEPTNCANANETLDSLSDVNSENSSVMILSDYDMVSDEEVCNDTVKGAANKVMYEEALQMATSVHLTSVESSTMDIESTRLSPSVSDQMKANNCWEKLDSTDEQDLLNYNGNDQNKLEHDKENNGSTTQNIHQLCESSSNDGVKPLDFEEEVNVPILGDSWVKVESFDIFKKSDQVVEISQEQKDSKNEKYTPFTSTSEVEVDICNFIFNPGVFIVNNGSPDNVQENATSNSSDNNLIEFAVSKKKNVSSVNVGERLSPIGNNRYFMGSAVRRENNNLSANLNENSSSISNVKHLMDTCLIEEFNVMGLKAELLTAFHMHGFQDLKEYQKQCISHCINGNDVVYHSYPCVGKSTIGILSVLQKIDTSFNQCQAIILVPTIELALRAQKVIKSLGKFLNVSTCVGSVDVLRDTSPVPHVVISTLQSLIEMINSNVFCTDSLNLFVIDDADELFNCIGFYNQIKLILLYFNKSCRLMIFSTSKIEEILDLFSDKLLHNPEYIIKPEEKPYLGDIIQYQVDLNEEDKIDAICELYEGLNLTHTVVYCNTWRTSKEISESMFLKFKYAVSAVHKTMDVGQREFILQQFQSGIDKMLVTEGFQRGEEFPEVEWVINYDLPKFAKDYVRRIIGCFDRKIKVINFITTNDATAKTNIETAFNVHMLHLPQNLINSCVTNLD